MSFHLYHVRWVQQLQLHLQQLASSPKPTTQQDSQHLIQLVDRVMMHYHDYYRVKSQAAMQDVLSMFSAKWLTNLERSLNWIAGWRPTTVFHLVYTESSARLEARIVDFLCGRRIGDLGDISPGQLRRVSELQCETVNEENRFTDELAEWQDKSCDFVSDCSGMEGMMEGLVKILEKADNLRLKTIRRVVEILTPLQAAEFLIAAAELQFGVRGMGIDRDRRRTNI